jgi:tight adherence protein B
MNLFTKISSGLRVDIPRRELASALAIILPVLFSIGMLFYNNYILAGLVCCFAIPVLKIYERKQYEKWRDRLTIGFMEVLNSLNVAFQMGYDMDEAIESAYKSLGDAYPENEPIVVELKKIVSQKNIGTGSTKALFYDLAKRSGISEMVDFVDVYYTAIAVGGDICRLSADTAKLISEKLRIQNDIKVKNAQKKYESSLLMLLPVLILVFLRFSSPGYLDKLYGTPLGVLIMTIALALIYFSYVLSERILDIDI